MKRTVMFLLILLLPLSACAPVENDPVTSDKEKEPVEQPSQPVVPPAEQKEGTTEKNEKQKPVVHQQDAQKETKTDLPKVEPVKLIPVTLVKTVDGDTIKIKYDGKEVNVRYLLIDTPETNHPRLGKQPFGQNAKDRNRELVNSGELAIEFDIGERYDKYGRLLAYVYVNGVSVQQKLVEEGLARVAYVYPPNTRHLTPFEETQKIAQQKKVGIWSIEDYATSSGFDEEAFNKAKQSSPTPKTSTKVPDQKVKETDFKNCTELRTVYPDGVPEGHPAYQSIMDRDQDGYACER